MPVSTLRTSSSTARSYNGEAYPIEVLGDDPEEWKRWNSWRNVNDDCNRKYAFSLAQDRHDPALWLFGGIWEVVRRRPEPRAASREPTPTTSFYAKT